MHGHLDPQTEYREVGGELVSGTIADSRTTHVEVLARRATGPISWRFRQPRIALFWFRSGLKELHLELDGRRIDSEIRKGTSLTLLPASTSVVGEFEVAPSFDYTVAFLDPAVASDAGCHFDRPLIGFGSEDLQRSLSMLCREARNADSLYGLFAEGWAMQALALLARIDGSQAATVRPSGGLAPSSFRRIVDYIEADLSRPFTIEDLARVAGVSPRHFIRAFRESSGQTPLRFVYSLRLERAKEFLLDPRRTATEIALDCGFSHAQHFSTAFKQATGMTPSEFRRAATH
ncbi:AraC family transcriptional regulator [Variovorax beijingensis]|uniref:AraC family transcriptional regulator n=2 Tax=Variovorax TaxID=34072 RepID=A0AAE4C1Y2_VARPD|nr:MULTISPECIES: AraC family transcriptional regulator [Variovorax]MDP9968153.1 AraC family transcriptional regulator [Variovorax paradoxus]MDR6429770.1 AraC family transcriptional regulator [Variovorax paradoxus]MDR6456151.1 AraC family transcriptional regulator [Variovorax paradoxus]TWD75886.1 AraC family transcriptional regulator [Variovorax beijingensis]